MIALTRFQLAAYVRSLRVLHPLIAAFLLLVLVLLDQPSTPKLIVGGYGDTAAFLFPLWAWTARALLDTEPEVQRQLSALAVGRRHAPAGLLAAYLINLALTALVLAVPLLNGLTNGIGGAPIAAAIALHLLAAFAATLVGACTSRAVLPSPAVSILALLAACTLILLLSMGSLAWLSVPMVEWLRAAHHGSKAFTKAFPGVALHLALWSAFVASAYLAIRRLKRAP